MAAGPDARCRRLLTTCTGWGLTARERSASWRPPWAPAIASGSRRRTGAPSPSTRPATHGARKETGSCHSRAAPLFVPDLGLCFGLCPHRLCLCAFDAPISGAGEPPAVRYVWDETYPREVGNRGFHVRSPGSLAYLGEGKFCIAWPIAVEFASKDMMIVPSRFALFLMAVQVVRRSRRREPTAGSGELRLLKRRVRCYKMSSSGGDGYVLQPSLG